jgi:hypothetical protein
MTSPHPRSWPAETERAGVAVERDGQRIPVLDPAASSSSDAAVVAMHRDVAAKAGRHHAVVQDAAEITLPQAPDRSTASGNHAG